MIDSGVDVVLLATPPGFRPQHLAAAIDANKHVFCEKPCAHGCARRARSVMAAQKLAQTKNLVAGGGLLLALQQHDSGHLPAGARTAPSAGWWRYYATYYTNPVKPMPPESTRPAGMSDVEWQIRNWYNFVWLCGDSLVEQAVHSVDKIAWAMHDRAAGELRRRRRPRRSGRGRQHLRPLRGQLPLPERRPRVPRQPPDRRLLQRELGLHAWAPTARCTIGRGPSRASKAEGQIKWQFSGQQYDMYQREHDVLFAAIRKPASR